MFNILIIILVLLMPAMSIYIFLMRGKRTDQVLGYGILTGILGMAVFMLAYKMMTGEHLYDAIYNFYNSEYAISSMKYLLDSAGVAEHMQDKIMTAAVKELLTTLPALFTTALMIYCYVINAIFSKIFIKRGKKIYAQPPFRMFAIPQRVFAGFLVIVVLTFIAQYFVPDLKQANIIANLVFIFEFLLTVQGMSLLTFYFFSKGVNKVLTVLVLAVLCIFTLSRNIFSLLGLLEVLFGLRLRMSQNNINKKDDM